MRKILFFIPLFLWTCGGGSTGPDEPKNPSVQNITTSTQEDIPIAIPFIGSDPSNLGLTYNVSSNPINGSINISGSVGSYTPNEHYHGSDTFSYFASNGTLNSNTATVSITITPVDDNPNTMNVNAITDEDNPTDMILSAEEYDGDTIQFNLVDNPSNGSAIISGTTATYTPNQDWYGTDTFTFEAVDTNAKKILNTATATITVNPINDAPTANNMSVSTDENNNITFVLDATDVEGDNLTYTIVSDPTNGTLSTNPPNATYAPNQDWGATDSFIFKVNDGTEDSNQATVSIDINNFDPEQINIENIEWNGNTLVFEWNPSNETYFQSYIIYESENSDMSNKNQIWSSSSKADETYSYSMNEGLIRYYTLEIVDQFEGKAESTIKKGRSFYVFDKLYGLNNETNRLLDATLTSDGGYVMVGSTNDYAYPLIYKVDSFGDVSWSTSIVSQSPGSAYSVYETSNGDLLVSGQKSLNDTIKAFINKYDSNGILLWNYESGSFNGGNGPKIDSVIESHDGKYIAVAGMWEASSSSYAIALLKLDTEGNEEWVKTIALDSRPHFIDKTSDGGYIITGGAGVWDYPFILKVDSNGDEIWSTSIPSASTDYAMSAIETDDGGYMIYRMDNDKNKITKFDSNGNQLWTKNYDGIRGAYYGAKIGKTNDGNYIFYSSVLEDSSLGWGSPTDGVLVKIDSEGNIIWTKTYGDSDVYESGMSAYQSHDGGFVIFQQKTTNLTWQYTSFNLIKVDSEGSLLRINF